MLRANYREEGVCYTGPHYRKHVALHMLSHAHSIFTPTSRIKGLKRLEEIFNRSSPRHSARDNKFMWSFDPSVVDAFRITTCFENLFKARLILDGWLIHEISRDKQFDLWKRQRSAPIRVSTVKGIEGHVGKRDIGYIFETLSIKTIQWRTLVEQPDYRLAIGLPERLFEALRPFAAKRNSLHFLALNSAQYSRKTVDDLRVIKNGFNRFVVQRHNRMVLQLGIHSNHLIDEI